ncbi:MAG: hypothetical protein C3F17_16700 [Bradyrhizobiaceae bacterium]|nr:MAG: hypothetical protein C3F17_16700 [Bradyrhizobiaceae bacterium]
MLLRFLHDRSANIAPLFGLAIIPILGIVGLSIDYGRANAVKADVQAALDATALALSKEIESVAEKDRKTRATEYFKGVLNRTDARVDDVSPNLKTTGTGGYELTVTASVTVPSTFAMVLRQGDLKVTGSSEVKWGMKRLEIALALDNTGSMAWSNKMGHLKTAVHNLIDQLKKASRKPGDVKVAIIPFDTTVNIGTKSKDEPWFDIDSLDCNGWKKGSGCTNSNWKSHWEGCVRDRKYPYDVQDDAPGSKNGTLYPVYECGSLAEALPLTNDWSKLKSKVDEMEPNGMTNVTIGLVWAWHALTPGIPYTQASAPAADLDKVIILLTDGENTEAWNNASNNKVTVASHIDNRTRLACDNVKAANIKLYTVRVIEGNASLLRACASNPGSMYFEVSQASQLNAVFAQIYENLASLRLSK